MDEFKGKVALITGAGRGAGREIALAFSSLGGRVAANDINPINLDETIHQIQQAGGEARAYVFDIAKRMPIEGMVSQVVDDFDTIDILVNCASVKPDDSLLNMDEWEFHRTLDVNLAGPYFCIQQVGRIMQPRGGVMVNLISATEEAHPQKGDTAYLASQAGLAGLTRAAASELSTQHIRLNAVCGLPGDWELTTRWDAAGYHAWRKALPAMPSGEHGGLVSLVLYLCSEAAAALIGQVISIR